MTDPADAPPPTLAATGDTYRWHDDFVTLPPSSRSNGRTHAAAELADGRIVVFHQADPAVLVCGPDGRVEQMWGDYVGAHGMTLLQKDGGTQTLLVTDQNTGAVCEHTPDGGLVREVPPPPAEQVEGGAYMPTWAAVGPDGSTWVADGYGSSLVFRFDAEGRCVDRLDGASHGGVGRFDCPHGIGFDPNGRLWIADRGNRRVVIADADGGYLTHSDTACHSPCMFAFHGGRVYVPELHTGVKVLTPELEVQGDLGVDRSIAEAKTLGTPAPEHWPDMPRARLAPGRFHTPHGLCVCADGSLIVCEWIAGGRITKLERVAGG